MNLKTGTELSEHNGLGLHAKARRFAAISSAEELSETLEALGAEEPVHILGSGTNTVWGNKLIDKTVLKMEIPGFEVLEESRKDALVRMGAGENWDECVARSIALGLSGIEALSGIPGTVGAGPVQNIGAYGQEIADCLVSVSAFDRKTGRARELQKSECDFSYRDSIFKRGERNFAITAITMRLSKNWPAIPNYPDVVSHFKERGSASPGLKEIREAIIGIRTRKLPDPKAIPNCGSFFKNPIVSAEEASRLKEKFPDMPQYPFEDRVKVPAGWLIDSLGLKGKRFGAVEVYRNNALVLTAPDKNATIQDVLAARDNITEEVSSKFGVSLEMEPELVS